MTTENIPGPNSPFDSFAGRLKKAMKKKEPAGGAPGAADPTAPPESLKQDPENDSFAGRLDSLLKKPGPDAAEEPVPDEARVEPDVAPAQPVGAGEYVAKQGDCISSIAKDTGHFWETIWNDSANADVRTARKDPNVLLPGDRIHVPPLRERWEPRPTEQRHRFRRKGYPEVFRVQLLRDGEPRGNVNYRIRVDGVESTGVSDANGNVSCAIAPNARRAVLEVGDPPGVDRYEFALGAIDPIDSISGVQGRLNNLGFDCGAIDGIAGPRTEAALRDYQRSRRLSATGEADEETRRRLQSDYGC